MTFSIPQKTVGSVEEKLLLLLTLSVETHPKPFVNNKQIQALKKK